MSGMQASSQSLPARALHVARIGWLLFVTVLKRRLAYRGDLLIQSLDEIMRGLLALVLVKVYMSKAPSLHGWQESEILFILGFALIPLSLFHCLCGNLYGLAGRYLVQGEFDRVLLRPYPTFLQICFDRIAIEDLSGLILGIGIMTMAIQDGAIGRLEGVDFVMLPLLLTSAFLIVAAVFMAFAALSFWFDDRVGLVPPIYNLMEFGRWPIAIYNDAIKVLITLVIPFAFTAFYPASWFIDHGEHHRALLTPLVAALCLFLASCVWRAGVRRYNSTGH